MVGQGLQEQRTLELREGARASPGESVELSMLRALQCKAPQEVICLGFLRGQGQCGRGKRAGDESDPSSPLSDTGSHWRVLSRGVTYIPSNTSLTPPELAQLPLVLWELQRSKGGLAQGVKVMSGDWDSKPGSPDSRVLPAVSHHLILSSAQSHHCPFPPPS